MKTIFAVDDSDTNLSMAKKALENRYRVFTMSSAVKMFSLLQKITPDLILLDIEMPEMNGFEALERLKINSLWANIPVLFLTGTINAAIEERSQKLGAAGVVTKPFSAPVLFEHILKHVK